MQSILISRRSSRVSFNLKLFPISIPLTQSIISERSSTILSIEEWFRISLSPSNELLIQLKDDIPQRIYKQLMYHQIYRMSIDIDPTACHYNNLSMTSIHSHEEMNGLMNITLCPESGESLIESPISSLSHRIQMNLMYNSTAFEITNINISDPYSAAHRLSRSLLDSSTMSPITTTPIDIETTEEWHSVFGPGITHQEELIYLICIISFVFCMVLMVAFFTVRRCRRSATDPYEQVESNHNRRKSTDVHYVVENVGDEDIEDLMKLPLKEEQEVTARGIRVPSGHHTRNRSEGQSVVMDAEDIEMGTPAGTAGGYYVDENDQTPDFGAALCLRIPTDDGGNMLNRDESISAYDL